MRRFDRVRKAVVPAAGLGTRFLPATKMIPKEMLPIVDTPTIQLIIEEIAKSGIEEVILITAHGKEVVENHFRENRELERELEERGKKDLAAISKNLAKLCKLTPVIQEKALGLGHAVWCAKQAVGDEPFAVLLGDDLIDASVPCTKQCIDQFLETQTSIVGVMEVPLPEVSKYGVVGGTKINERLMKVEKVIEKPKPENAPTRLVIPGRYVLSPKVFELLEKVKPGAGGEIQLTDGLEALAKTPGEGLYSYVFEGKRYDAGDRLGFIEATLAYAKKRPELRTGLKEILERQLKEWPQ